MNSNTVLGYLLALLVGISLGLFGSGGSILSVPILVYVIKIEPILATTYSLFVVGSTALVGSLQKVKEKMVDFKKVILFGIPTIIGVLLSRNYIVPAIPNVIFSYNNYQITKPVFIMVFFAIVMIFASINMINTIKETQNSNQKINYIFVVLSGSVIGLVAGFVGAGGGFLIIPALLTFAKTPIKIAVGTSLFIVAIQSIIGFFGSIASISILNNTIILFTLFSIIGFFIGNIIVKKIKHQNLKTSFGWFILSMGFFIICKELFYTK